MKYFKFFAIFGISLLTIFSTIAQTSVHLINEVGKLKEKLGEKYNSVETLTVVGKINNNDIATINAMPNLKIVDLQETTIVDTKGVQNNKFPNYAMFSTKNLEKIKLPKHITSIGTSAFQSCKKLKEVVLGEHIEELYSKSFSSCQALQQINFPSSLHYIGASAFYGTIALKDIDLSCLDTISKTAFYGSGIKKVTLSDKIKYIGDGAFCANNNLELFSIDKNNQYYTIEKGMLLTKDKSTLLLYLPSNHNEIVRLPSYITKIGLSAMENNPTIKELHILGNVISIPNSMCRMTPLEKIYLPHSLQKIDIGAFDETSKTLKEVHFQSKQCPNIDPTSFGVISKPINLIAYIPQNTYAEYEKNEEIAKIFSKIIEEKQALSEEYIVRIHTNAKIGETIPISFEAKEEVSNLIFEGIDKPLYGTSKVKNQDIIIKGNIKSIDISNAKISSIELYQPELETLLCSSNQIEELNLNHSKKLKILSCDNNLISQLDLSENTLLKELDCSSNQLSSLDINNLTSLKVLLAHNNLLAKIDFSFNKKLLGIDVSKNKLTHLNFSNLDSLETIYCYLNNLSEEEVNKMSLSLSNRSSYHKAGKLFIIESSDLNEKNKVCANAINTINDGAGIDYDGSTLCKTYEEGVDYILSKDKLTLERWLNEEDENINMQNDPILSKIKYIGSYAFMMKSNIRQVILPKELLGIKYFAFYLSGIKNIHIPSSLRELESNPFAGSISLINIEVEANNAYFKSIDSVLYSKNGKKLLAYPLGSEKKEYQIPEGVEIIGELSFSGVFFLKKIAFPSTLRSIETLAFEDAEGLTSIEFNQGLKSIGFAAFKNTGIEHISIPSSVEFLGSQQAGNPFMGAKKLQTINIENESNYLKLHNGILYSKDMSILFACPTLLRLNDFYLPSSVKELGEGAFAYQANMKSFTMNQHINIPKRCFDSAMKLQEVYLLTGTSLIESQAFFENPLTKIAMMGMNIPTLYLNEEDNSFEQVNLKNTTLIICEEMKEAFSKEAKIKKEVKEIIANSKTYTYHRIKHHSEVLLPDEIHSENISNPNVLGYTNATAYGKLAGISSVVFGEGKLAKKYLFEVEATPTSYIEPYLDFDHFSYSNIKNYEESNGRELIKEEKKEDCSIAIFSKKGSEAYSVAYYIPQEDTQKQIIVNFKEKEIFHQMHIQDFICEHYLPAIVTGIDRKSFKGFALKNIGIEIMNQTSDAISLRYAPISSYQVDDTFIASKKDIHHTTSNIYFIKNKLVSNMPIAEISVYNTDGRRIFNRSYNGQKEVSININKKGTYIFSVKTKVSNHILKIQI